MKAAFFHDTKLSKGEDGRYYSPSFSYKLWQRYLEVFDELIICTRESNEIISNYERYGLSSGENVEFKLNKRYKNPVQFFIDRRKIRKPIKEVVREADCCIVRLPSIIGILAVKECIKQNKPWAVEVVACCWDSLWNYGNIKGKILAPIMYLLNRYYIKNTKYSIYVSKDFLPKRYPCKGIVANVSDVNIESVDEKVLYKKLERINTLNDKMTINLGLIGSLDVDYKGHKTAILAVKEMKERGYSIKLKCLGGGKKDRWVKLCEKIGIENDVEFCGTLPSGKPVLEWIDNIDVFIMPSLQEGLPRSMVEAMSRGCNVIGSRVGGIPELLDDNFIINPKDYNQLSNLVINLIEDKGKMLNQSKNNFSEARKYIKDELDKERLAFWNTFKDFASLD